MTVGPKATTRHIDPLSWEGKTSFNAQCPNCECITRFQHGSVTYHLEFSCIRCGLRIDANTLDEWHGAHGAEPSA